MIYSSHLFNIEQSSISLPSDWKLESLYKNQKSLTCLLSKNEASLFQFSILIDKDLTKDLIQSILTKLIEQIDENCVERKDCAEDPKQESIDTEQGIFQRGLASYYGGGEDVFEGGTTANGETFNSSEMTAAHPTLEFNTEVRVTLISSNKSVVVRINDRGPYSGGRIIDLSAGAAQKIGLKEAGVGEVTLRLVN